MINKKTLKNKRSILIAVAVVIILIVVAFLIQFSWNKSQDKITLKIGKTIILESEYKDFVSEAKKYDLDEDAARDTLINYEKAKIILGELGFDGNQALVNEHWGFVSKQKDIHKVTKEQAVSSSVGRAIMYLSYYDTIRTSALSKGYLGAVYNFPYDKYSKDESLLAAETANEAAKKMENRVSADLDYINKRMQDIPYRNASYSGIYIIDSEGSVTGLEGSVGSWPNLLPKSIVEAINKANNFPYVSDVVDVNYSGVYFVRVTNKFDFKNGIEKEIDMIQKNIDVVEYDR